MVTRFALCLALALGVPMLVSGCQSAPSSGEGRPAFRESLIRGTVSYVDRMALPAGSDLVVELVDVTGKEPVVIAAGASKTESQVPVGFEVRYDPDQIESGRRYALMARLSLPGDDQPTWVTPAPTPIVPMSRGDQLSLLLVRMKREAN